MLPEFLPNHFLLILWSIDNLERWYFIAYLKNEILFVDWWVLWLTSDLGSHWICWKFFFSFFPSLSSVSWYHGYIPSIRKSSIVVCCSPVCKIRVMCVLVIKQEITEGERGSEKACGAKSTFYISRILLSKICRLCICLKWCINLMVLDCVQEFGWCRMVLSQYNQFSIAQQSVFLKKKGGWLSISHIECPLMLQII